MSAGASDLPTDAQPEQQVVLDAEPEQAKAQVSGEKAAEAVVEAAAKPSGSSKSTPTPEQAATPAEAEGEMMGNGASSESPEEIDETGFYNDAGLPGSDATVGNYMKRKLTKSMSKLTCGLTKKTPSEGIPGYTDLGDGLDRDERGAFLKDNGPWDKHPELIPRPHLSFRKAKARRNERSVRRRVVKDEYHMELQQEASHKEGCLKGCKELKYKETDKILHKAGDYVPYNFDEPIPFYKFPGMKLLCPKQYRNQTSPLDECGEGVVAYFKIIKSLIVVFGLMCIITLPNIIIFSQATAIPDRELFYTGMLNSQTVLATSTIAAMSEPIPACIESIDTQVYKFRCPTNFYISSIVAYYGQPTGACACPYPNQVDAFNNCKGTKGTDATTGLSTCVPNTSGLWYGQTLPCYSGQTRFGNRCCGYTKVADSDQANLGYLNLAAKTDCNSLTAPYIVNALCAGKQSCQFTVSASESFSFPVSSILKVGAGATPSNICQTISADGLTCTTTLAYNAATSGCAAASYATPSLTGVSTYQTYKLMTEAICQTDFVTIGYGPASVTLEDEYIANVCSMLNSISIVIFIFGIFWIERKVRRAAETIGQSTCTASDYTIMTHTLPKGARSKKEIVDGLTAFFEKQLFDENYPIKVEVADVNVTTSAQSYLEAMVARGNASMKVDQVVGGIQSRIRRHMWWEKETVDGTEKNTDKRSKDAEGYVSSLKSALLAFEIANDKVQSLSSDAANNLSKAYVTFKHELVALRALHKYPNIGAILTPLTQSKDIKMDGNTVFIEKAKEPEEIIFENVPMPGWERAIRQMIGAWLTILFLGISYAMIFEAKIVATQFEGNKNQISCEIYDVKVSKDASVYSGLPATTITYADVLYDYDPSWYKVNASTSSWGSYNYLECYCSQVAFDAKNAGYQDPMSIMKAYTFYDARSGTYKKYCDMMLSGNIFATAANYIATFVIVVVNLTLAFLMEFLVNFEKHSSQTTRIISMMIKLFIAQYINTAFLSLIIAGDISRAGGKNIRFGASQYITFGIFTGTTQDYDTTWYATVGSSIMFTMFMFTIGNQPTVLISLVQSWGKRTWDRRFKFESTVTHCDTQKELDALYMGPEMQMQVKYAAICTLIFVDMTYSATEPLFNYITFLNLVVMYASDKYMLFHLFRKPPVLNSTLPLQVVNILYFAAVIHVCNGMWMWGNNAFYNPDITTTYTTFTQGSYQALSVFHSWVSPIVVFDRVLGLRSRFLLAILCFLGFIIATQLLKVIFLDLLGGRIFLFWLQEKTGVSWLPAKPHPSIEMERNPTYFEAILPDAVATRLMDGDLDEHIHAVYEGLRKTHVAELYATANESHEKRLISDHVLAHMRVQERAMVEALLPAIEAGKKLDGTDMTAVDAKVVEHVTTDENERSVLDTVVQGVADAANLVLGGALDPKQIIVEKAKSQRVVLEPEFGKVARKGCFGDQTADNGCKEGTACAPGGPCAPDPEGCCKDALCMEDQELPPQVNYTYDLAGEKFDYRAIKGHESYNMSTVPLYQEKFGFQSDHMDRYFSTGPNALFGQHFPHSTDFTEPRKDWVLADRQFAAPEEDKDQDYYILSLIRECLPPRVRTTIKEVVYTHSADGKVKREKVAVERDVIPWQAAFLDSNFGMFGGAECVNGKKGCECLAQPRDLKQPKWTSPCGEPEEAANFTESPAVPAEGAAEAAAGAVELTETGASSV